MSWDDKVYFILIISAVFLYILGFYKFALAYFMLNEIYWDDEDIDEDDEEPEDDMEDYIVSDYEMKEIPIHFIPTFVYYPYKGMNYFNSNVYKSRKFVKYSWKKW